MVKIPALQSTARTFQQMIARVNWCERIGSGAIFAAVRAKNMVHIALCKLLVVISVKTAARKAHVGGAHLFSCIGRAGIVLLRGGPLQRLHADIDEMMGMFCRRLRRLSTGRTGAARMV